MPSSALNSDALATVITVVLVYGGMGGLDMPATVQMEPEMTWDNALLRPGRWMMDSRHGEWAIHAND